jgi:hypothetical protein
MVGSTEVEASRTKPVVHWQLHNFVAVNDDFRSENYTRRVAALANDPQVRLAAALACVAFLVAAFDLLMNVPGL